MRLLPFGMALAFVDYLQQFGLKLIHQNLTDSTLHMSYSEQHPLG